MGRRAPPDSRTWTQNRVGGKWDGLDSGWACRRRRARQRFESIGFDFEGQVQEVLEALDRIDEGQLGDLALVEMLQDLGEGRLRDMFRSCRLLDERRAADGFSRMARPLEGCRRLHSGRRSIRATGPMETTSRDTLANVARTSA